MSCNVAEILLQYDLCFWTESSHPLPINLSLNNRSLFFTFNPDFALTELSGDDDRVKKSVELFSLKPKEAIKYMIKEEFIKVPYSEQIVQFSLMLVLCRTTRNPSQKYCFTTKNGIASS